MNKEILKNRSRLFALKVIKLSRHFPNERIGWIFSDQLVRSATSVAANYRSACRAKSAKDFISKLETTTEEADEAQFWLGLLSDAEICPLHHEEIRLLEKEANELTAIFVASVLTIKKRTTKD